MLKLEFDHEHGDFDLVLGDRGLEEDDGLATPVIISLFSDARARPGDEIPDATADPRGWWGDTYPRIEGHETGSRLWLHERSVTTQTELELAKRRAEESLAWMVEDGIAASVTVHTERQNDMLAQRAEIVRPDGDLFLWAPRWGST